MGKVVVDMSVSLDGFITAPGPSPEHPLGPGGERLHQWLFEGDTPSAVNPVFKLDPASREVFDASVQRTGAVIVGRRWFDVVAGWSGKPPLPVPHFVLTHQIPPDWAGRAATSPFTFVTDGLDSALRQARAAAAGRDVAVGGASVARQCLNAGLLDEVLLHVVPVVFGGGTRLFEDLHRSPVALQQISAVPAPEVTHLRFRVVSSS